MKFVVAVCSLCLAVALSGIAAVAAQPTETAPGSPSPAPPAMGGGMTGKMPQGMPPGMGGGMPGGMPPGMGGMPGGMPPGMKGGMPGGMPPGHPPMGGGAAQAEIRFTGAVLETMNAGGYTYVQVDTGSEKIWAAAPQFTVKVGDKVSIPDGIEMPNYHSSTLNRDFPLVYFVGGIGTGEQLPPMTTQATVNPDTPMPAGLHPKTDTAGTGGAAVSFDGLRKAEGGRTVGEIIAGTATLTGKEVAVRGKVVKYNAQIMGKNWIHVQDGTGAAGANDLTLTTSAEAKIGDTVLVKGILAANRDFGMGYRFAVIIEDAVVTVE